MVTLWHKLLVRFVIYTDFSFLFVTIVFIPLLSPGPSPPAWPASVWQQRSLCWSQASGEPEMQGSNILEKTQKGRTM